MFEHIFAAVGQDEFDVIAHVLTRELGPGVGSTEGLNSFFTVVTQV